MLADTLKPFFTGMRRLSSSERAFVPFVGELFPFQTSPQFEELFRALRKEPG